MTRKPKVKRAKKSGRKTKRTKGQSTSRSSIMLAKSVRGVPARKMLPDEGEFPDYYENQLDEAAKEALKRWFE